MRHHVLQNSYKTLTWQVYATSSNSTERGEMRMHNRARLPKKWNSKHFDKKSIFLRLNFHMIERRTALRSQLGRTHSSLVLYTCTSSSCSCSAILSPVSRRWCKVARGCSTAPTRASFVSTANCKMLMRAAECQSFFVVVWCEWIFVAVGKNAFKMCSKEQITEIMDKIHTVSLGKIFWAE